MKADQLRASILQDAVIGKLVPQLDDEPAVEQIGEAPKDVPFSIPEKWKWVKLQEIQTLVRGITFPASAKNKEQIHGTERCLTTGSIQKEYQKSSDVFVDSTYIKKPSQYLQKGDVIYSAANSRELVGKSIYWNSEIRASFGGFLTVSRVDEKSVIPEYWYWVYQYLFLSGTFRDVATQTINIANLSNKIVGSMIAPIPPVSEQHRIVARLNELLPLIETYGKEQEQLERLETELPGKLRASILQEAVMGKLVPQLDGEPTVEQIGEAPEDVPFAIPEQWKWVQLKRLVQSASQKVPDKAFTYIDVSSINGFKITSPKRLDASSAPSRARKIVQSGSVLYSTVRPYLMNVCVIDRVEEETIASTAFATMLCREAIINTFLFYVLISPFFTEYVKSVQRGASYPAITDRDLQRAWIPVPPIEEQRRIVAKVEELMAQVDRLAT